MWPFKKTQGTLHYSQKERGERISRSKQYAGAKNRISHDHKHDLPGRYALRKKWGDISMRRSLLILASGMVGVAMIGFGLYQAKATMGFLTTAQGAQGIISGLEHSNSEYYYPQVTYRTEQGTYFTFTGSMGSNPAYYDVGDRVHVLYNPENAYDAKINGLFSLWGTSLILCIIGAVSTAIALTAFNHSRRQV